MRHRPRPRRRPRRERLTCACGKRAHESEHVAAAHLSALLEAGRDLGHRPLNVYRCDKSAAWHVGHRPTTRAW